TGLALDGLDQYRDRGVVDRVGDGGGVTVGNDPEAGRERPEVGPRRRIGGEAHDADGAAVEVAVGHDDGGAVGRDALDLVAPLAGYFEPGLDRLGAGVHGQDEVLARQRGEIANERAQHVVVESAAGQRQPVELGLDRRDDLRVPMPEVEGGVRGQTVEIAAAFDVGDPGALRVCRHDGQRVVIVRGMLLDEGDRLVATAGLSFHEHSSAVIGDGVNGACGRCSSSVVHLTPPPAFSSSDTSTGTGSKPATATAAARCSACSARTTWRPSLTALSPSTSASALVAMIASG